MKTIGSRRQVVMTERATGEALAEVARFSEAIAHLAKTTFIPKGVYRFKRHEAANKHQEDCVALAMGMLAAERTRDGFESAARQRLKILSRCSAH
jgi:hypothetical protein